MGNIEFVAKDFSKADKYLQKSCDGGDLVGCDQLAASRLTQRLLNAKLNCGSNDKSSSCKNNILKNACDEGISIACLKNEYNQKACKEYFDKKHGCNYTDLFSKDNKTGIRTRFFNDWCIEDKDFNLLQKCEGRDGGACYKLGLQQHRAFQYKEAEFSLRKACRLLRKDACNFLKKNYHPHL